MSIRSLTLDRELMFTHNYELMAGYGDSVRSRFIVKSPKGRLVGTFGDLLTYAERLEESFEGVPVNRSLEKTLRLAIKAFGEVLTKINKTRELENVKIYHSLLSCRSRRAYSYGALFLNDVSAREIVNLQKIVRFAGVYDGPGGVFASSPYDRGTYNVTRTRHPIVSCIILYVFFDIIDGIRREINDVMRRVGGKSLTPLAEVVYWKRRIQMALALCAKYLKRRSSPGRFSELVILMSPARVYEVVSFDPISEHEEEIISRDFFADVEDNSVHDIYGLDLTRSDIMDAFGSDSDDDEDDAGDRVLYNYADDVRSLGYKSFVKWFFDKDLILEDGACYALGLEVEVESTSRDWSDYVEDIRKIGRLVKRSGLGMVSFDTSVNGIEIKTVPFPECRLEEVVNLLKSIVYDGEFVAKNGIGAGFHVNLGRYVLSKDSKFFPPSRYMSLCRGGVSEWKGFLVPPFIEESVGVLTLYLDMLDKNEDLVRAIFGRAKSPYASTIRGNGSKIGKIEFVRKVSFDLPFDVSYFSFLTFFESRYCPMVDHDSYVELRMFGGAGDSLLVNQFCTTAISLYDYINDYYKEKGFSFGGFSGAPDVCYDILDGISHVNFLKYIFSKPEKYRAIINGIRDSKFVDFRRITETIKTNGGETTCV